MNLKKRILAADLLQRFLNSEITNDDYDSEFPDDRQDAGLYTIYDRIWLYYSGLHTHFLDRSELEPSDLVSHS